MAVIYLRHPVHGEKVACSDFEATEDRKNGWEDFDPTKREVAPAAPAVPSFLAPTNPEVLSDLPEDFPGRDLLIESGYVTWESVVDLNREQLIDIKGIGPKTADAILEKMNG